RSSDHRIINNIIWDNDDHEFILVNNNPTIEYNIVKNGYDGTGNISDNPQFYDPDNNDFTLSASSPAIDAGHPDLDQDGVNWESDPDDQDLDGTRMDIGCCTFLPEVSLAELSVAEVSAIHGDTVLVDIFIDEVTSELSSIDLSFSGFQDKLTLVDIIADGSSLMGTNDWTIQYNDTEDLLITAAAGAQDIIQGGKLFSLEMAVHDTLVSQYIPVEIVHYLGNDNLIEYTATSGGVHVLWLPEAGFSADVTSGDYPLTVTFIDTSVSGTYPIIDRQWDFGNDSTGGGDTVSMIYNYPGIYDVGLSVVDEFGLSDTLVKYNYIQVDTVFGDIDFNAIVETEDAYTVLSHVVGLTELDSLEFVIADVSTNSSLSPLDATLILQYLNGDIAVLPFVPGPGFEATGQVEMEDQDADPDMMLDIPVNLTNGSNIYGFTGTIQYDPAVVELDTILFSNVLQNYLVSANPLSPGVIILSAAGIASAGESDVIAILSVYVTEAFSEATSITITDLSWNEGEAVELAAEMTINFGLSVDGLQLPDVYALHQNYPNPFNPFTTLSYDLPENAMVNITIYDMMGRVVKTMVNSEQEAGFKSIQWDGTNHAGATVSAGLYLYTIQADNFHQTKKMILLK
ncbi:MAG: FlgD immunoglobulin-like domain containing protein, partial [Candidatus Neomarinimicrobiota bacterium]|nr:FlgD immunoglobulin-like domain containing protein [Candidatus Neomarinimicrobiota bacterium]